MYYCSKVTHELKAQTFQTANQFKDILNIPKVKFITEMTFGIIASKSILLSHISKEVCKYDENIKHTTKRLLRNIKSYSNHQAMQDCYQQFLDKDINENTIFCVDNSDISKGENTKKFEYIHKVRDGSTGAYKPGYYLTSITALIGRNHNPLPVYSKAFSLSQEAVSSLNIETEKALLQSFKHHGSKGIYTFDRGYDSVRHFQFMQKNNAKFVVRINLNRKVIINGKEEDIKDVIDRYKGKINFNYRGKKVKLSKFIVELPKIKNQKFMIVVVNKIKGEKAIYLTNIIDEGKINVLKIAVAYQLRWRIETFFKFLKQRFDLENIRFGKLKDINLMLFILHLATYIIGKISINNTAIKQFLMIQVKDTNDDKFILFDYNRIHEAISKLFNSTKITLMDKMRKRRKQRFLQPELF